MPIPTIADNEMLVQIEACGLCGSDVMEWYRKPQAPIVLGHELAGSVARVGSQIKNFNVGDRIVLSHHVPCMECRFCKKGAHTVCDTLRRTHLDPGGLAQFARVPKTHISHGVFHLPDSLSYEDGAFAEPLACAIRALRLAKFTPNSSCAVIGCGVAGLVHIILANYLGASNIIAIDINPARLKWAKSLGARHVYQSKDMNPQEFRKINQGNLADLVITASSNKDAITQALSLVERSGTLLFFAPPEKNSNIPLELFDLWRDNITLVSSYAAAPQDIKEALEFLKKGSLQLRNLISHRLGLEEAPQAFHLVSEAKECLKVMLLPNTTNHH